MGAPLANRISAWVAEAQRRRVLRTVGVYIVAVWGISSGGVDIAGVLGIPEFALRVGILAAIGFIPVVIILAWRFDIGRTGIVRDPEDALAEDRRDADLADMPTITIREHGEASAIVVRWSGANGENASLFTDEFYLGRGTDCRVRFYDPLVSRRHARIFRADSVWYIEDLGSRGGTLVDERKVERILISRKHEVRLNEEGPVLRIELVAAGAEIRRALDEFPPGQPTAHVRLLAAT
jgi:hypothetical protein